MKLGVSTSFQHSTPQEWIKKHVDLGLKSIVFPLNCDSDISDILEYSRMVAENDMIIAEVGVWRNTLSADKKERNQMIEYAIRQLTLADSIHASCCVNVVGTPHGPRWDGGYAANFDNDTRKQIIEMIRTIIDEAKPENTKYSVEPMPWMVPTSPDDYLRLLEEVDRDEFGVHLDLINMVTSPERYFFLNDFMDECLEKLGGKILSCHLKDIRLLDDYTFQLRECACGEGILDIPRFVSKLDSINPDLPLIIEHLNTDEEYVNSVKYVQGLLHS